MSTETLKSRRTWNEIFQTLKENTFKPRILSPAELSFIVEGKI
jgi:hypothetical protein